MINRLHHFYLAHIWGFKGRCRNLFLFASAAWHFDWISYHYLLRFIEIASREMTNGFKQHPMCQRDPKNARELLVLTNLCKRLREDRYFDNAGYRDETWDMTPNSRKRRMAIHSTYMEKQDVEWLQRSFKNIQCWWS